MKKRILSLLLTAALLLTGCASLLERSYSVVEPYTDRYWDPAAEDILRAESYQDLVNTLLMLIEQRAQEGVIRYYAEESETDPYLLAMDARREVWLETVLGSYLLQNITLTFTDEEAYSTLTFKMSYRQGTEDPESLMALSDTQSLVDLLRLAVREGHDKLTARFFTETAREDVEAAVESLWQELHQIETPSDTAPENTEGTENTEDGGDTESAEGTEPPQAPEAETPPAETTEPPATPERETPPADPTEGQPLAEATAEVPPCPWRIHFYPTPETAELVEILLTEG